MATLNNSQSLTVEIDAAATTNELECYIDYRTWISSTKAYDTGNNLTVSTTGTIPATLVAGNPSSKIIVINIGILNSDTVSHTVTLKRNSNWLWDAVLSPGERLVYDGRAWYIHTSNGSIKTTGQAGVNGTDGALTVSEAEIDLGLVPVYDAVITVPATGVTPSSSIIAVQSGKAATGLDADENELDKLIIACVPGTDEFTAYIQTEPGPVSGLFKINFQFS